jgi:hypothetical protein
MIPHVEDCYFYTRKDGILIGCLTDGTQVPLVKFYRKFTDLEVVSETALQYMKDFMQINPTLWWYLEKEVKQEALKEGEQIQLF